VAGGFLASTDGSNYFNTDTTWKCSANNVAGWSSPSFDDSSWSPATSVGRNDGLFGIRSIVTSCSPLANWIWTSNCNYPNVDRTVYCRGYLSKYLVLFTRLACHSGFERYEFSTLSIRLNDNSVR